MITEYPKELILLFELVISPKSLVQQISGSVGLDYALQKRIVGMLWTWSKMYYQAMYIVLDVRNPKITMQFWKNNVSSSEHLIISVGRKMRAQTCTQLFITILPNIRASSSISPFHNIRASIVQHPAVN